MITKIYISIQNGGDGSAYPRLMESKELCEIDQKFMDEGWAEDCSYCIRIKSDKSIVIEDEVTTIDMVIKELEEELNEDYMKKYKAEGKYPDWFSRLECYLVAVKKLKKEENKCLKRNTQK